LWKRQGVDRGDSRDAAAASSGASLPVSGEASANSVKSLTFLRNPAARRTQQIAQKWGFV
jgi:hypothetical protein